MIEIEMLPAKYGDSIWIRYGRDAQHLHHVLIDTGFEPTANEIRRRLREDPKLKLDLLVLTHIDADHIEGVVYLLQDKKAVSSDRIADVWFNGWEQIDAAANDAMGAKQGEYVSALIRDRKLHWNEAFGGKAVLVPDQDPPPAVTLEGGMTLRLLSPTRERLRALRKYWVTDLKGKLKPGDEKAAMTLLGADTKYEPDELGDAPKVEKLVQRAFSEDGAQANGSSIAFLAEYQGIQMLFTGDAFPSVVTDGLRRLGGGRRDLAALKVSHHGSKHNTSPELLSTIRCERALISTSGEKFEHPDAECIARLVAANTGDNREFALCFNYASDLTKPWIDRVLMKRHGYSAPVGNLGSLTVTLG